MLHHTLFSGYMGNMGNNNTLGDNIARKKQRYKKYEQIGQGACKKVYKGFDECEGIEVAWNEVDTKNCFDKNSRRRLFDEIKVLSSLKHKNVMALYDHWFDQQEGTLVFITELFTHGSLRQYRKKLKKIDEQVLKRWSFQVLQGLVYLHGHNPPIIHRDLKCDNLFINGASGEVKVGDLGLATIKNEMIPLSVLGTPEFMAPELYDEDYDAKVDIYSFGMCILELATKDYPYSECNNAAQIYRKVTRGIPPAGLARVESEELREFIQLCINFNPHQRPEARQLLKHPFFNAIRPPCRSVASPTLLNPFASFALPNFSMSCSVSPMVPSLSEMSSGSCCTGCAPITHTHSAPLPALKHADSSGTSSNASSTTQLSCMEGMPCLDDQALFPSPLLTPGPQMAYGAPPLPDVELSDYMGEVMDCSVGLVELYCEQLDECTLDFKLRLTDRTATIGFCYNLLEDTVESVTSEMVDSLALHMGLAEVIADRIARCVARTCTCCNPTWH